MKRLLTLLLIPLLLGGCTALPAEERSFAVALGVSYENAEWMVGARIPTYQTGGGYTTVTGKGSTLDAALASLDAAAPMQADLGQLRLLVFSASLARTKDFPDALEALSARHDLRMDTAVAVTEEEIGTLMDALKPSTGSRLSKSVDVLLETRVEQGRLLNASLGDLLRMGERRSPVLMNAELEEGTLALSGAWPVGTDGTVSEVMTPEETQLLALMLGQMKSGTLTLPEGAVRFTGADADAALSLPTMEGAAVRLTLRAASSPLTDDALSQALAMACLGVLNRLSAAGCDALGLARQAITHADDMDDWRAMEWPERYRDIDWSVSVGVTGPTR